mmetsp:Transcript_4150/g.12513  ORF Transcript_4150/g.12513 Transcript_4150/m.12513 type:complete len:212 (-) Transcript_4150:867-1502(-)
MISVVLNPLFVLQRGVPPCNSVEIVGSQPGNLTQFAARVLLRDSPQGRRARGLVKVDQEGGAIANLALRVAAMLLESPWPSVLVEGSQGGVHGGGRDQRGRVLHTLVVDKRQLRQEERVVLALLISLRSLEVPQQKVIVGGNSESVLEGVEHDPLHLQQLLLRVGLVANEHKVLHLWRPDLLVLGRQEHGRDADELQVLPVRLLLRKEAVD